MNSQTVRRLSSNALLLALPLEEAREAVWRACVQLGWRKMVIDAEANQVAGYAQRIWRRGGDRATASFQTVDDGTLITLTCLSEGFGAWDFGRTRRAAPRYVDDLAGVLDGTKLPPKARFKSSQVHDSPSPIASPDGATLPLLSPVYAPAPPIKRGGEAFAAAIPAFVICKDLGFASARYVLPGISSAPWANFLLGCGFLVALVPLAVGIWVKRRYAREKARDFSLIYWALLFDLFGVVLMLAPRLALWYMFDVQMRPALFPVTQHWKGPL